MGIGNTQLLIFNRRALFRNWLVRRAGYMHPLLILDQAAESTLMLQDHIVGVFSLDCKLGEGLENEMMP
jgi:hypothetical protein